MFRNNIIPTILLLAILIAYSACEKDSPCKDFVCQNGGNCVVDDQGNPDCDCPAEWTGTNCETAYEPCLELTCENGGTCAIDTLGQVYCECPTGFLGAFCQDADPCVLLSCPETATCEIIDDVANCICNLGYEGEECEIEIREKYLGTYNATSTCDNEPEFSYELTISANPDKVNRMDFDNINNLGLTFYGIVLKDSTFVVPLQMDVNGGIMKSINVGIIEEATDYIKIRYQYELAEEEVECELVLTPQ